MTSKDTAKTMYLSKYALTAGIKSVDIPANDDNGGTGWVCPIDYMTYYKIGRDIHETHAAAVEAAEAARLKKIKSMKAQLRKLEALSFAEQKDGAA